jgi:hypothetical protein
MSVTEKPDLILVMLGHVLVFYPDIKHDKFKLKQQAAFSLVSLNTDSLC